MSNYNSNSDSDWNTWRVWVKDGIRNARNDIVELYQITHELEKNRLLDRQAIVMEVNAAIGKTRKEMNVSLQTFKDEVKEEFNEVTINLKGVQVKLTTWAGIIAFIATILGTLLVYWVKWEFWTVPPGTS